MEGSQPLASAADPVDTSWERDLQKQTLAMFMFQVLLPILTMELVMSAELSLDIQDMERELLKKLMKHPDMARDLQNLSQSHMK